MKTLTKQFESRVAGVLERTGPSVFGRPPTGDPNLMRQLRLGRSPTQATANQVLAFLEAYHRAHVAPVSSRGNSYRMRRHIALSKAIHPTASRAISAEHAEIGGAAS